MAWKETLYERRLRRPIDDDTRQAINTIFHERRHEIPVHTELHWHPVKPQFTLKSKWLSFVARFTAETLVVDAELTLAAKMMVTAEHRGTAVRFIDEIANTLNL